MRKAPAGTAPVVSQALMAERIAFELDLDTAVEMVGDGRFATNITDRWSTFNGPDGGYVMTTVVRALSESLPFPDPVTTTAHFLRPPVPGPATIETKILRQGRRFATGSATMFQDKKPMLAVLSTFSNLSSASGRSDKSNKAPMLPPPDECIDPFALFPESMSVSIGNRVRGRVAEAPGWLTGSPSGKAEIAYWFAFADGRAPDPLSMMFVADGVPPAIFELGEMASITLELTVHVRARAKTEWLACRKSTRHVVSGLFEEDCEMWDANGDLVAQSRQLAKLL